MVAWTLAALVVRWRRALPLGPGNSGEVHVGSFTPVAVARALIGEPEVVLADEPTANLDTHNAEKLIELMLQMCEETQTTFLFSTHDERVIKSARRLIHLRDGKIEKDERKG